MLLVWTYFLFILTVSDAQFLGPQLSNSIKCTGEDINLPWSYNVIANNASTVRWKKDGSTILTWIYSTNTLVYDASNGYSSSKIVHNGNGDITIKLLKYSDAGEYECSVVYASSGMTITSAGVTLSISCNNPCVGICNAVKALCIPFGCPEAVRVIICIIIYCWCTQKVTITATADKKTNLKSAEHIIIKGKQQTANLISAKQMFNMGKQHPIPIHENKECSIVALGGESHACVFETDAGVLSLTFKIKDDLLNAIPGQTIHMPTLLVVDPKYSSIKWFHNGREITNDSLYITTRVTRSTYGVYNIIMKFEALGLTILIEKMRVQGRYWMLIVISVPINVLCGVIGAAITEYYRSTDGFCISVIPIIIPAVLCVIVNGLLVAVLVYNLFKRRTEFPDERNQNNTIEMQSSDDKKDNKTSVSQTPEKRDGDFLKNVPKDRRLPPITKSDGTDENNENRNARIKKQSKKEKKQRQISILQENNPVESTKHSEKRETGSNIEQENSKAFHTDDAKF